MNRQMKINRPIPYPGFTIVELLIVIVVIGILAALVISTFTQAQDRANNASKITSTKQIIKLIKAYRETYGTLPAMGAVCATLDNQCTNNSATPNPANNTVLMNELKKVGSVPQSMQPAVEGKYGIQYIPEVGALNGVPTSVRLEYWLKGSGVPCGISEVSSSGTYTAATTPATGYTSTNGDTTVCWIRI